jgi:restriction system protein
MEERTIWGIHGGAEWEADDLFRKKNVIAIGWHEMGDLSTEKDREEYKEKYPKVYKDASDGEIRNAAGIFYRFVYEMKIGDTVIYPSMPTRQIYIGKILGPYRYAPNIDSHFPNQREVKWLKNLPRTHFSQQALYEIGSALTLFQVRNNADEFVAALEGEAPPVVDEEVATITEDIEAQTRDFILKQLSRHYKGEALEGFVIHLLEKMGYHARRTVKNKPSVDIIAHKDELGFESPLIKCQVKSEDSPIKLEPVEKLYSNVNPTEFGLFIALSSYSDKASRFAEGKSNLRLVDGYELVEMILAHYDELDTQFKNSIPLKKGFLAQST